jgi:predicted SAM-dependent methyltransferase
MTSSRLHIGCGDKPIRGWLNIDVKSGEGVDAVFDVRQGLPYRDCEYVFAEHFIEHLELEEAFAFLRCCRDALGASGVLRLSTPNLDWVMLSHYRYGRWLNGEESVADCIGTNMAFHGWGHHFLYNFSTLKELLNAAGFANVEQVFYGESANPDLRGLEQHERSPDWPGLPHVIVAEASGVTTPTELPEKFVGYLTIRNVR